MTRIAKTFLCLLIMLSPVVASAHHIMGLPHYKYGDDYPQLPYAEVMAMVGDYDVHFTYFPGTPKPGERVRLKVYVVERESRAVYREPLKVQYARERWLRSDENVGDLEEIRVGDGPEGNDYKFFHTFDEADAFLVKLHFPNGDSVEVLPFPVQIGVTDARPFLFGSVLLLLISVAIVGVIKRRRAQEARK